MSATPEQIVRCLDELELYSDDPIRVTRVVGELRERLHTLAVDYNQHAETQQDTIDDLRRQLTLTLRLPV